MARLSFASLLLTIALLTLGDRPRLSAQPGAVEKVIGGPYVVNVGQRAATVMWVVQTGQVAAGAEPSKLDQIVPVLRSQKTTLNGLKAGTTYHYQAFAGDAGKGSFKTAPAGEARFQFVVYGDTRTRHEVHRSVINGVLKNANPDFVVHTGDLVENGADPALWPIFFDAEAELLRKTAFFPALGNHERHANNYDDFMDAKPYYSFNWGSAHLAIVDSDIGTVGVTQAERDSYWQQQVRWLEDDLEKAQKSDFRFVFAHHPPMTAVKRRQGASPHMTALEPLFKKYRLTAGFFGHDHNYQHYLKDGIHYFITGGGGGRPYTAVEPPARAPKKVESTENFVIVNVDGKKIHIEAKRPNGSTIDVAELGQ